MVQHHFFLFRHCLRSTTASYSDLVDETPDWQAPRHWCLGPTAMDLVFGAGKQLGEHFIPLSTDVLPEFEIVSDDRHRDIDTAFMLQAGLRESLGPLPGLDTIETSIPFVYEEEACSKLSNEKNERLHEILERLDTVRRPQLSKTAALALIQEFAGGQGLDGVSHEIQVDADNWQLKGAARVIHKFAETLFFAKAANLDYAPDVTPSQVYQLLQYHNWYRSILHVNNTYAASKGALWFNYLNHKLHESASSDVPKITIAVAHDSDIDYLATALGVTWNLDSYETHEEFLATPAGSAMHFTLDTSSNNLRDARVKLEYLAPVYHNDSKPWSEPWEASLSPTLFSTPVTIGGKVSVSFRQLQERAERVLSQWPISYNCYEESKEFIVTRSAKDFLSTSSGAKISSAGSTKSWVHQAPSVLLISIVLLTLAHLAWQRKRCSRVSKLNLETLPSSASPSSDRTTIA